MILALAILLASLIPVQSTSTLPFELGTRAQVDVAGTITAIRYFRWVGDPGPHIGHVWGPNGQPLAAVTFTNETPSGWQQGALPVPVALTAGQIVTVSVNAVQGAHFAVLVDGLLKPQAGDHYTTLANGGAYSSTAGVFPAQAITNYYFRDLVFQPDVQPTITLNPDVSGGYAAVLNGFQAGPYTLGITLRDASGAVISSSLAITMPVPKVAP